MAPLVGLEPTTCGLTVRRSTDWAKEECKCWHYLSSRAVARQVLSAQMSLTSVFGMGTGGPSLQSIPTLCGWLQTTFMSKPLQVLTPWIIAQLSCSVNKNIPQPILTWGLGDPYRIRTDVKGVRGLCLNHLTNGPWCTFRDSNPGPTD